MTTRKNRANRTPVKPRAPKAPKAAKPEKGATPMGKRYNLNAQEVIQYQAIQSDIRLANEKRESAALLDKNSTMQNNAWKAQIIQRLGLQGKRFEINVDTGIVFVPDTKKGSGK